MTTRILHIATDAPGDRSAAQMMHLAAQSPQHRLDVHCCRLSSHEGACEDAAQTIRFRRAADPLAYFELRQRIRRLQPRLIHTWGASAARYGVLAAAAGDVPLIATLEGDRGSRSWAASAADHLVARRAAVLVAADHTAQQRLAAVYPAARVQRIPYVVTSAVRTADARQRLLAKLSLPPDVRLIVASGKFVAEHHYKDLIWSAELLGVVHHDLHLLILGDGPQRRVLERYRQQVISADNVHLISAPVELHDALAAAELFWSAAGAGGSRAAIAEAMAAGLPVVATDTPGHRELLGDAGQYVPLGGCGELARRTYALLEDAALRERLAHAVRQRAGSRFAPAAVSDGYFRLYDEVLRGCTGEAEAASFAA